MIGPAKATPSVAAVRFAEQGDSEILHAARVFVHVMNHLVDECRVVQAAVRLRDKLPTSVSESEMVVLAACAAPTAAACRNWRR